MFQTLHITLHVLTSSNSSMSRYQHLGEMMTLGTNDGAVSVSFIEGITLDGILGHTGIPLTYFQTINVRTNKEKDRFQSN